MKRSGKNWREGLKLKRARHSLNMSQGQFAEWLGVCPMTPSEWERGNYRIPKMLWILLPLARKAGVRGKRKVVISKLA